MYSSSSCSSYSHFDVGSMYDDIRLRVARSYTSSADSPFSLISPLTLSYHLLLGLPLFRLLCTLNSITILPTFYVLYCFKYSFCLISLLVPRRMETRRSTVSHRPSSDSTTPPSCIYAKSTDTSRSCAFYGKTASRDRVCDLYIIGVRVKPRIYLDIFL